MKILSLLLTLFLCSSLSAQSNLVFFSDNGEPFFVVLNGIQQNANPETNVTISGLNQPVYKVKILFANQAIPEVSRSLMLESGTEAVVMIRQNKKGKYKMAWMSETPLEEAQPVPSRTRIVYTDVPRTTSQVVVTEQTTTVTESTSSGISISTDVPGVGIDINVNVNDPYYDTQVTETTTVVTQTTPVVTQHAPVVEEPYIEEVECYPMSRGDFDSAMNSISKQSFSDTKLKVAKRIVSNQCLTAAQIKNMVASFSFEDDRLTLAKHAYESCVDQDKYYIVAEAFTFSSSTDELMDYIGQ